MSTEKARLHAIVHGRVQGVNFRYYTRQHAQALGLTGWVANRSDGTVETIAEGSQVALDSFLAFLHKGPISARVDQVKHDWSEASGDMSHFQIRYPY